MSRLLSLVTLFAWACVASGPFSGPGFQDGALVNEADGPYFAVATRAIIASGQRSAFNEHVGRIRDQLEETEGCIGYELRGRVPGREVWTLTVWESEDAMLAFMTSGAHAEAMRTATELVAEFDSAAFEVEEDDLPVAWDRVEEALAEAPAPTRY
ncbi:MAG: antibiotic biosynthesis monooxygenase [Myxococcota bacterium]